MADVRCLCKKILCQTELDPDSKAEAAWKGATRVIIKCRHCKRYLILHVTSIEEGEFVDDPSKLMVEVG